jgi:pimeloyl-ACP methyl ester carboxylesterase
MTRGASPFAADAARTGYIEAGHSRLAYRVIGLETAPPLVLAMRFRGVMDQWDPAFVDGLATSRRVHWFDSAGIGLSSGEVPDSIPGMARVLIAFIEALGMRRVDLLGWSMGGYVVQSAALQRPDLVRRLIVAGSGPGGVPDAPAAPEKVWKVAGKPVNDDEDFLYLFFPQTPAGITAGRAHLARLGQRAEPPEPAVREESVKKQVAAFTAFRERDAIYPRLTELSLPILYANGAHDLMVHPYNSYAATQRAPNAQAIIYPGAGHGFLFQHHSWFVRDLHQFLHAE